MEHLGGGSGERRRPTVKGRRGSRRPAPQVHPPDDTKGPGGRPGPFVYLRRGRSSRQTPGKEPYPPPTRISSSCGGIRYSAPSGVMTTISSTEMVLLPFPQVPSPPGRVQA